MIRWGKVIAVKADGEIVVTMKQLSQSTNGYKLKSVKEVMPSEACPFFKPKVGDIVALHWGHVVKKLTKREEQNLIYWTQQTLVSVTQTDLQKHTP